jgi:hypothetical protein
MQVRGIALHAKRRQELAMTRLVVRWTIGDVSDNGFKALRLSILGAQRIFGDRAHYAVCVNTRTVSDVCALVGRVRQRVSWIDATHRIPSWLRPHLDKRLAEGVAWKFAPLQLFRDAYELAIDNDCILWSMPDAVRAWLGDSEPSVLLAEDVRPSFGQFAALCGSAPRNSGIRGLPPGFDLERALRSVLELQPTLLGSELDEQGLQVAALQRSLKSHVVSVSDVAIASPFPPHLPHLGRCGAHFCGLNGKHYDWTLDDLPAECHLDAFFRRHLEVLHSRVGAEEA